MTTLPPPADRLAPSVPERESAPRDEGAVTLFVVVLSTALLAMAGLVIDGGYALAARQEASSVAEQAARAGADALSPSSLHSSGPLRLDPAAARRAAESYLATTGHDGQTSVAGDAVTVTVRITRPTAILSAIGIEDLSSSATATARGLTGIDRPNASALDGTPLDSAKEASR
ncbi:MAG: TadE/TadG family type IV pilus assembly protein [Sporichthyaceae bacterium]